MFSLIVNVIWYFVQDLLTVSARIDSADRKIDEKAKEIISTPRDQQSKLKEELKLLTQGRDRIAKQRDALDAKVREQAILSPAEDRRLIEIDEGIEALDAAIEYKNENIFLKQQDLRNSISIDQVSDCGPEDDWPSKHVMKTLIYYCFVLMAELDARPPRWARMLPVL